LYRTQGRNLRKTVLYDGSRVRNQSAKITKKRATNITGRGRRRWGQINLGRALLRRFRRGNLGAVGEKKSYENAQTMG